MNLVVRFPVRGSSTSTRRSKLMYFSGSSTPKTFCSSASQNAWVSCFSSPLSFQSAANCLTAARCCTSVMV